MARILFATFTFLAGFLAYIGVVLLIADRLGPVHWALQLLFFAAAGVAWVIPTRWLMLWTARK